MSGRVEYVDVGDPHLRDGVLLALHDGEPGDDFSEARTHLERCAECRGRLAAVAQRAALVHHALGAIDVPPFDANAVRRALAARQTSRRASRWTRRMRSAAIAASVTLVAAMAALALPARRWFAPHDVPRTPPVLSPSTSATSAPTATPSGSTVSFGFGGPAFTIRLDSVPRSGMLLIERSADDRISAHVALGSGTGGDAMIVLPGELRLRNTSASRASYSVALPRAVERLRVIVAGRTRHDGPPPARLDLAK
jgi:hypothetical protein